MEYILFLTVINNSNSVALLIWSLTCNTNAFLRFVGVLLITVITELLSLYLYFIEAKGGYLQFFIYTERKK